MRRHYGGLLLGAALLAWVFTALPASGQDVPTTRISPEALRNPAPVGVDESVVLFEGVGADSDSRIGTIAIDRAGSMYLVDILQRQVRVLDASGVQTAVFSVADDDDPTFSPARLAVARDTIAVVGRGMTATAGERGDRSGLPVGKLRLLDGHGALLAMSEREALRTSPRIGATDSGWSFVYFEPEFSQEVRPVPLADSLVVARVDPSTFEITRVAAFPGPPRYMVTEARPLARAMALFPTIAVASDGTIYTNSAGGYVIDIRAPDGAVERRIVGDVERIPYTDEEFQSYLAEQVREARARGSAESTEFAAVLEQHGPRIGHAEYRPVLGSLVASRGGRVLVRRLDVEPPAPGFGTWDLLDVEEGLVGRLHTPPDATVEHFEWPYLYVRLNDLSRGYPYVRFRILDMNTVK